MAISIESMVEVLEDIAIVMVPDAMAPEVEVAISIPIMLG